MLAFTVKHAEWVADGQSFSANDNPHEIAKPSAALVRCAAGAHAADAIEVSEGLDLSHVQSQEDGEQALAEAMGEFVEPHPRADGTIEPGYWTGPWGESNRAQAALDAAARAEAGLVIEVSETQEIGSEDVAVLDAKALLGEDE